jgi:hypothetical protein
MRALHRLVLLSILVVNPAIAGPEPRFVEGSIQPSHFQFKKIVSQRKPGTPGGWKAACVIAQMNIIETEQKWECIFEVGVPQENSLGPVSEEAAAVASALTANKAAHVVLSRPPPHVAAAVCQEFRSMMETLLKPDILGAKVSALMTLKKTECTRF